MHPQPGPGSVPGSSLNALRLHSVPKDGTATKVRFLGNLSGVLIHLGKTSAFPCPGRTYCKDDHNLKTVWKGYAPVEVRREAPYRDWLPAVLEVTERMYELLVDRALRGEVWSFYRLVNSHSPKECSGHLLDTLNPDRLSPPFDVTHVAARIYRTTRIAWDMTPSLPPRTFVQAVVDDYVPPGEVVGSPQGERLLTRAEVREMLIATGQYTPPKEKTS